MGIPVIMVSDNVLVRPEELTVSKGGIFIPDSAGKKERPSMGEILAAGEGAEVDGKFQPMRYKVGMRVMYHTYPNLSIADPENPGRDLYVIQQKQIVGVMTDKGGK